MDGHKGDLDAEVRTDMESSNMLDPNFESRLGHESTSVFLLYVQLSPPEGLTACVRDPTESQNGSLKITLFWVVM
jgi:hypothetical protein